MLVIKPEGMNPHHGMESVLEYESEESALHHAYVVSNQLGGLPVYESKIQYRPRPELWKYPHLSISVVHRRIDDE